MADPGASISGQIFAVITAFSLIASFMVALRLFTRGFLVRRVGYEDCLILLSLLLLWGVTICIYEQIHYGLGKHSSDVKEADMVAMLKPFFFSILLYNGSLALSKLSILTLYLSFFFTRPDRIACYIVIGLVVAYGFTNFMTGLLTCSPIHFFWTPNDPPDGKCLNREAIWFANAAWNIASDCLIICLPMKLISGLRMPLRQRLGLMLVFMVGFFTCITSVIRLKTLKEAADATDITWTNSAAASWSVIEASMAITCACLPTLKPLIARLFPKLLSSSQPLSTTRLGDSYHNSRTAQFSNRSKTARLDTLSSMHGEEKEAFALSYVSPAVGTNATVIPHYESDNSSDRERLKEGHIQVTTTWDQSFADKENFHIESPRDKKNRPWFKHTRSL